MKYTWEDWIDTLNQDMMNMAGCNSGDFTHDFGPDFEAGRSPHATARIFLEAQGWEPVD